MFTDLREEGRERRDRRRERNIDVRNICRLPTVYTLTED